MTSPIAAAFGRAAAANSAAFMPYLTAGFPDSAGFLDLAEGLGQAGADLMEIGLPFSDPVADGPVIQAAGRASLEAGMTPLKALELVDRLRGRVACPLVLMTYFNPVHRLGLERFAGLAQAAGAAGAIIPDLPPEEADEWRAAAGAAGLATVFLAAPNTPERRLELILTAGRGFLYLVSLLGVTGQALSLSAELLACLGRLKARSALPVAVGFGVARPDQAALLARLADGVIVGSALIRAVQAAASRAAGRAAALELAGQIKRALARNGAGPEKGRAA